MKDFRLEVRWPPGDPVGALLAEIPAGTRSKLVRAILDAALHPGGWARITNGQLSVPGVAPGTSADPAAPPRPSGAQVVDDGGDGMSDDGRKNVLASLVKFGALD